MSGILVKARFGGSEYDGLRGSLEQRDRAGSMGAIQGASGSVRLKVSDLTLPVPKPGDDIDIVEPQDTDWKTRTVLAVRYDQTGATVRIDYGEKYGG